MTAAVSPRPPEPTAAVRVRQLHERWPLAGALGVFTVMSLVMLVQLLAGETVTMGRGDDIEPTSGSIRTGAIGTGVPLILCVIATAFAYRRHGWELTIGTDGVHDVRRGLEVLIAWRDITAIGYTVAATPWHAKLSFRRRPRQYHLEVFVLDAVAERQRLPTARLAEADNPRHPRLPRQRLRFGRLSAKSLEALAGTVHDRKTGKWVGLV